MNTSPSDTFGSARNEMVDTQLIPRGISDERVIEMMRKVPRHLFVPAPQRSAAYEDRALPIGEGQTISQPYMVAIMTELLGLSGAEKVLEIGTGSGYQAAILAELSKKVITVEWVKALSDIACSRLKSMGYGNIECVVGDGSLGFAKEAPFDAIIVTAACPRIPPPLTEQLGEGGRLILPVGDRFSQILTVAKKENDEIKLFSSIGCVFVPLLGKYGFKD